MKELIDKKVLITSKDHPHHLEKGKVVGIETVNDIDYLLVENSNKKAFGKKYIASENEVKTINK